MVHVQNRESHQKQHARPRKTHSNYRKMQKKLKLIKKTQNKENFEEYEQKLIKFSFQSTFDTW